MAVKHGVFVYENDTAIAAPITAENSVQVVIGTAPVFMLDDPAAVTNVPIMCSSATEAMEKLGFCTNFADYTLCQSMYVTSKLFRVAPVVYINVLDVSTMKETAETVTLSAPISNVVTVDKVGVIKGSVAITQGSGGSAVTLEAGTDYTLSYTEDGKLVIHFITGGSFDNSEAASVSVTRAKPSQVAASNIVGTYNSTTGVATGAELIRYIYPKLGVVPSILLAPGWSQDSAVGVALSAKAANINGVFKGIAVVDIDTAQATTYTATRTVKESSGFTSPYCYPVWPCFKVGGYIVAASAVAAALMAYTDAQNDGVPARTPSNKLIGEIGVIGTCLASGAEVIIDQDQGTIINGYGIATAINMNGWRLWGSYTGAYPGTNDPKDMWLPVRRMFNWQGNNFILTYFSKVDDPMNRVLIDSVVDSENIRCAAFAPDKWAGASIEYLAEDNPITDVLAGKVTFRQRIAPYTPAQEIDNILSYDTQMLQDVLANG